MASEFAGKSVVVTGGATGIGAAIVRAFHRDGARVTILDLNDTAAAGLAAELGAAGMESGGTAGFRPASQWISRANAPASAAAGSALAVAVATSSASSL